MDDGSSSNGGPGDTAADSYGFANPQGYSSKGDYSLSMYDIPVHLSTGYVWQVPLGRGKALFANTPRWLDEIVGGWTKSGTQIFQSGYPLFIIANSAGTSSGFFCSTPVPTVATPNPAACGNGNALNDVYLRPNRIPGVAPIKPNWKKDPGGLTPTGGYLNPAAWAMPGSLGNPQFGTGRRSYGDIRNSRIIYWNASLRKRFVVVPERVNFELWADIPNIMNHANYRFIGNRYGDQGVFTGSISTTAGVSSFLANPSFGDTNGGGGTRQINLGVALTF